MPENVQLFGAKWLEEAGITRQQPRFNDQNLPLFCPAIIGDPDCCGWLDLLQWNSRTRHTEGNCYQVWQGKFLPQYIEPFYGHLHYYGQHPLEIDCVGVYYVHNELTGSMDAFRRNLANGSTIDQLWSAPIGILPVAGSLEAEQGVKCLSGPARGYMSFIEFNDMVCFVGYEEDILDFSINPSTGELTCTITPGPSYLQVRDAWTGAIIKEGTVDYYTSGVYANGQEAFYNNATYGRYWGPGRGINSAVAIGDGSEVYTSYSGGMIYLPACARVPSDSPTQYFWARQGGKMLLEWVSGNSWTDTEQAKEDFPIGNAFLAPGPMHHVLNSNYGCLPEPDPHSEPSHSACVFYNPLPARNFLSHIHNGANRLSKNIISGGDYGVGAEEADLLVVRGLNSGQVFKLGCPPADFAYVIQDALEGGDSQEDIDKCYAEWDEPDTPINCNDYLGDFSYAIQAVDLCSCSAEVVVENCVGPCKPFVAFEWYLCLKQDCDYSDQVCTYGPVDCFTQLCSPVGSGTGVCGEPFWVPLVQADTTLVLKGYDNCGCRFLACKPFPAQPACTCPIDYVSGVNSACLLSTIGSDLVDECTTVHSTSDCLDGIPITACGGTAAYPYVFFCTTCPNTRLWISSWTWYNVGSAGGGFCEDWNGGVTWQCHEENGLYGDCVTGVQCGYYWWDNDCEGNYYEVGWDVTVVAINLTTGASCSKTFRITIQSGGTP